MYHFKFSKSINTVNAMASEWHNLDIKIYAAFTYTKIMFIEILSLKKSTLQKSLNYQQRYMS